MAVDNPYADRQADALQRSAVARQKMAQLAFAREAFNQKMMQRAEKETKARSKYLQQEQENDLVENIIRGGGTLLGGVAGGIIGSIVPGAGTMLGASLGASAGGALGSIVAGVHDYATDPALPAGTAPMPKPDYAGQATNQLMQGGQTYLMNQMYGGGSRPAPTTYGYGTQEPMGPPTDPGGYWPGQEPMGPPTSFRGGLPYGQLPQYRNEYENLHGYRK